MISANYRENQEFLINSDFYISSALPKCKSHLCWPARVSIFSTCEEIAHLGGRFPRNRPPRWAIRPEIAPRFAPDFKRIPTKIRILKEIPDFGH